VQAIPATGFSAAAVRAAGPFDLVLANIIANQCGNCKKNRPMERHMKHRRCILSDC